MTTTTRASARWTKGWKKVAAVIGVGGIVLGTLLLGAVGTATVATACPSWCEQYTASQGGGSGQYCSVTGQTKTLTWGGASITVEYPKAGATGTCQYPSYAAAKAYADEYVATEVARKKAAATSGYTEGACQPKYRCEPLTDSASGSAPFCDPQTGRDVSVPWATTSYTVTYPVLDPTGVVSPSCDYATKGAAEDALATLVGDAATIARDDAFDAAEEDGYLEGVCPTPEYRCEPVTVSLSGGGTYCLATGVEQSLAWSGSDTEYYYVVEQGYPQSFECPMTKDEATVEAQRQAEANLAEDRADVTGTATPGTCAVTQSWIGEASRAGSVDYCTVDGTTVTVDYSGTGRAVSTVSQAAADYEANVLAQKNADADLLAKAPADATPGACPADIVAPVLPGTIEPAESVAVPAAATVPVPTAAQPLPATVPAGDGSSTPTVPAVVLTVLVLGATALAISAVRLAGERK